MGVILKALIEKGISNMHKVQRLQEMLFSPVMSLMTDSIVQK